MTYHDHVDRRGGKVLHSYAEQAHRRMQWHYGAGPAAVKAAGQDREANDDIAAWKRLGGGEHAAAEARHGR
jgi:hypothetical protein